MGRGPVVISWTADTDEGGQDRGGGTGGTKPEVSRTRPRATLGRLRWGEEAVKCGSCDPTHNPTCEALMV